MAYRHRTTHAVVAALGSDRSTDGPSVLCGPGDPYVETRESRELALHLLSNFASIALFPHLTFASVYASGSPPLKD
jgi:hypothetical protein